MAAIEGNNTIDGAMGMLRSPVPPQAAQNEVQTVTLTGAPTGGTIALTVGGMMTAPIPFNATAAQVAAAVAALPCVGAGNVTGTGGPLPAAVTLTYGGAQAGRNQTDLVANGYGLSGGNAPAVVTATTTQGAPATGSNASPGQLLMDMSTGTLYENKSQVPGQPNLVKVGADA